MFYPRQREPATLKIRSKVLSLSPQQLQLRGFAKAFPMLRMCVCVCVYSEEEKMLGEGESERNCAGEVRVGIKGA